MDKTIQLDSIRLIVEDTLTKIVVNEAEDAPSVSTVDQTIVRAYLSGLVHNQFGSYPYRKDGIWFADDPKNIEDTLMHNKPGLVNGVVLAKWAAEGKVRRMREIKPDVIYRLTWTGLHYKTHDVVFVPFVDGEYEGLNGPRHDRNTLSMLEGFARWELTMKKNTNVVLGYPESKDPYYDKVTHTLELIANGDMEGAKKHYNEGAEKAQLRGAFTRLTKKNEEKPLPPLTGKETVIVLNGEAEEETLLSELFGKTIFLSRNNNTMPFTYFPEAANAGVIYRLIKQQKASVVVHEG